MGNGRSGNGLVMGCVKYNELGKMKKGFERNPLFVVGYFGFQRR